MKVSAHLKSGTDSCYLPLSRKELEVHHLKNGCGWLHYDSEDVNDWLYTVYSAGVTHDGISIDIEHGKISACYYETAPCWEVYDNRPFPAKDAPGEEWDEYFRYGLTEEAHEHFVGYADPFDTPEEELRVDLELELSVYEAYLLLREAFPTITPQEMLTDLRALCENCTIPKHEEVSLNMFLGWLKTAFSDWPKSCGGIPYNFERERARARKEGIAV